MAIDKVDPLEPVIGYNDDQLLMHLLDLAYRFSMSSGFPQETPPKNHQLNPRHHCCCVSYIYTHLYMLICVYLYAFVYHFPTGWGPQDSVQLVYKWLNSMVYGRYNELVNGGYFMVYTPTNITGGPHFPRFLPFDTKALPRHPPGSTPGRRPPAPARRPEGGPPGATWSDTPWEPRKPPWELRRSWPAIGKVKDHNGIPSGKMEVLMGMYH